MPSSFQGSDETTIPPSIPEEVAHRPLPRWAAAAIAAALLVAISLPLARRYWPAPAPAPTPTPTPTRSSAPAPPSPPSVGLLWVEGATLEPGELPIEVEGADQLQVFLDGELVAKGLPYRLDPSVPSGLHTLEVRAQSAHGHALDRRRFRREAADPQVPDQVGPQVEILHPSPPWRTRDGRVALRVRDPSGLSRVEATVNGRTLEPALDAGWTILAVDGLASGSYTLKVLAVDRAGNERRVVRRFVVE